MWTEKVWVEKGFHLLFVVGVSQSVEMKNQSNRYNNILTRLQGIQDKPLYLYVFSVFRSLSGIERQKLRSHARIF